MYNTLSEFTSIPTNLVTGFQSYISAAACYTMPSFTLFSR